jgi:IS5 family transposase
MKEGSIVDATIINAPSSTKNAESKIDWLVAAKKGRIKAMAEGLQKALIREWERRKAQVQSKVEHPFHIIKNLFKYRKVRYRGLRKNLPQYESHQLTSPLTNFTEKDLRNQVTF